MKNVLITGYNGLLGKKLVEKLMDDFSIIGVGRSKSSSISIIQADLSIPNWTSEDFPESCDTIIHLAQSDKFRDFPDKVEDVLHVNTLSTIKLLDYARKSNCKKFIYASSGGVYGQDNEQFDESSLIELQNLDLGFYLSSKICSEILINNYKNIMDIVTLRFFFIYGEHQKDHMLIPRLVNRVLNDQEITIDGPNGLKVNPIHVDDAAEAVKAAINLTGSHVINVAGKETLSLKAIVDIIGENTNKSPNIKALLEKKPNNIIADITKMKELLHHPKITFTQGIQEVITKLSTLCR
jgi:UDP-glucose 4-epimerase